LSVPYTKVLVSTTDELLSVPIFAEAIQ
jgi:hypothetical protein